MTTMITNCSADCIDAHACNDQLPLGILVVTSALILLVAVLAVLSNSLVLLCVRGNPRMRSVANFFICSLSMADIAIAVLCCPVYVTRNVLHFIQFSRHVRKVEKVTVILNVMAGIAKTYSLSIVSVDRYCALALALRYPTVMTRQRCYSIITAMWGGAALCGCVRLVIPDGQGSILSGYYFVTGVIALLLPFIAILYSYCQIFRIARHHSAQIAAASNSLQFQTESTTESNKKAAYTVAMVIGICILCGLPLGIVTIMSFSMSPRTDCTNGSDGLREAWVWTMTIAAANSVLNPWIFALRNRDFKTSFNNIIFKSDLAEHAMAVAIT